jgi:hypothetical protein
MLCKKLGKEDSNNLVEFVHAEIDARIGQKSDIFLTKDDKNELSDKINEVKTDLIDRMNKNKTEILVWIVGTGILQFLMVLLFRKL